MTMIPLVVACRGPWTHRAHAKPSVRHATMVDLGAFLSHVRKSPPLGRGGRQLHAELIEG